LYVLVDEVQTNAGDAGKSGEGDCDRLDLSVIAEGEPYGTREWGYTVGQKAGRQPIVLPVQQRPSWTQAQMAQRARQQSSFLVGVLVLVGFVIVGFRRRADLWTRSPEERAYYWPGRQSREEQEQVDPEGIEMAADANEDG